MVAAGCSEWLTGRLRTPRRFATSAGRGAERPPARSGPQVADVVVHVVAVRAAALGADRELSAEVLAPLLLREPPRPLAVAQVTAGDGGAVDADVVGVRAGRLDPVDDPVDVVARPVGRAELRGVLVREEPGPESRRGAGGEAARGRRAGDVHVVAVAPGAAGGGDPGVVLGAGGRLLPRLLGDRPDLAETGGLRRADAGVGGHGRERVAVVGAGIEAAGRPLEVPREDVPGLHDDVASLAGRGDHAVLTPDPGEIRGVVARRVHQVPGTARRLAGVERGGPRLTAVARLQGVAVEIRQRAQRVAHGRAPVPVRILVDRPHRVGNAAVDVDHAVAAVAVVAAGGRAGGADHALVVPAAPGRVRVGLDAHAERVVRPLAAAHRKIREGG